MLQNNAPITARTTTGTNATMMYLDRGDAVRIGDGRRAVKIDAPSGGLRLNNQVNGAGSNQGTLQNTPTPGDPQFWLPVNIAGAVRYVPCW